MLLQCGRDRSEQAYFWNISTLIPGIPVLAIMVRYNLMNSGVVGPKLAFFFGVVAPWLVTMFCYQASMLVSICAYLFQPRPFCH